MGLTNAGEEGADHCQRREVRGCDDLENDQEPSGDCRGLVRGKTFLPGMTMFGLCDPDSMHPQEPGPGDDLRLQPLGGSGQNSTVKLMVWRQVQCFESTTKKREQENLLLLRPSPKINDKCYYTCY